MKYRLSKILAAIEADKDTDNESAAECAFTVLRWLQYNPQKHWTDVLREWHWSLPTAAGVDTANVRDASDIKADLRRRIHDRLVEAAKKYGVPLEDC